MIKLLVRHGQLYTPPDVDVVGEHLLVHVYPAGDCDTCAWPMTQDAGASSYTVEKQRGILASALYDAYETGAISNYKERTVLLPDGETFNVDEELAAWEAARLAVDRRDEG
jgi:hypothetical protein